MLAVGCANECLGSHVSDGPLSSENSAAPLVWEGFSAQPAARFKTPPDPTRLDPRVFESLLTRHAGWVSWPVKTPGGYEGATPSKMNNLTAASAELQRKVA